MDEGKKIHWRIRRTIVSDSLIVSTTKNDNEPWRKMQTRSNYKMKNPNFMEMRIPIPAVLILLVVLLTCFVQNTRGELGGPVRGVMLLDRVGTPYHVKEDLIIEETGELTIRPGVQLLFSPTVGITVFGRLIAEGTENDRIVMTTSMGIPSQNPRLKNTMNNHFYSTLEYATATELSMENHLGPGPGTGIGPGGSGGPDSGMNGTPPRKRNNDNGTGRKRNDGRRKQQGGNSSANGPGLPGSFIPSSIDANQPIPVDPYANDKVPIRSETINLNDRIRMPNNNDGETLAPMMTGNGLRSLNLGYVPVNSGYDNTWFTPRTNQDRDHDSMGYRAKRALTDPTADVSSVRLVEGPTPLIGRLQMYHRGHWRSVCSNSRNWTAIDLKVVCREMGFTGGEYWPMMDHLNDTKQLLWEKPQCQGLEGHLKQCSNWAARQLGAGVCDHHPNLAIRCDNFHKFPSKVEHHWRGIRFENAPFRETYIQENTLRIKESLSSLKYVDIFYAGVGNGYNTTSALESIGVPPVMGFIRVENSAYNGVNISSPTSIAAIRNSTFRNNAGFGIYVNSSSSGFVIDACRVESNGNDGIRYVFNDAIPDKKVDLIDVFELCTFPITPNQVYPVRLSAEQFHTISLEKKCKKRFSVRSGYFLTMHFPYMMSKVDYGAEILVYDGPDSRGDLLTTIRVKNDTWPQSVTSTRDSIYVEYTAKPSTNILVFMDLVAGKARDYELLVSNSVIASNNGRGIAVENMRSQVIITSSSIKENSHISGVHILHGVGHVNISRSEIMSNVGDGVNITYGGGSRNISRTVIASNTQRGIAMWFNQSSPKVPCEQDSVVEYSEISRNLDIGIFVGNFCANAIVNISGNIVRENKRPGIEIWACWNAVTNLNLNTNLGYLPNTLKLVIAHNRFLKNEDVGIKLRPLTNMEATIEHNYFTQNSVKGCLLIESVDKKELETLPARAEVSNNVFERNSGLFVVALGLNHFSPRQKLIFTQNFVRFNKIQDPLQLIPRSRVAAAVVISSANIDVYRNILQNPESKYEIGSHMQDQSFELNCTHNWLGSNEEKLIYYRIFDRKDRFNLARILFIPFLLNPTDPNTEIMMETQYFVPTFDNSEKIIGGEITGREDLTSGEYKVVRDISVRPGGRLQISYGVTLKFLPSVGIMVGGQFHAEGFGHGDGEKVRFTLFDVGRVNATDAPVRLTGGRTRKDGRLQVRIGNEWGSVCNYEFDVQTAAIACRQMGFVLNPHDWLLERFEIPQASPSEQILMSNVRCTSWDNDITKCEAEMSEDIENSCSHDNVVGIRCYDTSWAGIRLAITADKGVMKYSVVEKAGLLDPHTNEHKPAIQMDFSHHVLSDIRVSDNTGDGLGIIYSDVHFPDTVNTVDRSEFSRNLGNGVLMRQLGLHMRDCMMEHNKGAGILHDPAILRPHQREMAGWISVGKRERIEYLPMAGRDLWLDDSVYKYLITKADPDVNEVYNIIAHDQNYIISIQLLNPLHNETTEDIWIYDRHDIPAKEGISKEQFPDLEIWSVKRDQVTFPTLSSSYGITLWFKSGSKPRGNCIILVRAIRAPVDRFLPRTDMLEGSLPKLKIHDSRIRYNGRGIAAIHYNRYENEDGDIYLRKANESIEVLRSELSFNQGEAIYVFTQFREIYQSNISEITFMINQTIITDNNRVIVQYSKDLRSSNNIYHWLMRDNIIERNKEGGFQVSLPYVWQYNENHTHSVHFQNVTFRHNQNFETVIAGHFSKVTVVLSNFENNICKHGLFTLSGMEKQIMIFQNRFISNQASHIIQFESDSQSEIIGQVQAYFVSNQVKLNRVPPALQKEHAYRTLHNATYQPRSYAIGLKGCQKINVTNNLFGENQLDYELLAGIKTAKLENNVNVAKNWWGTSDWRRIRDRIFDFDDWNSYAIANYRPYLLQDNFESPISTTFEPENEITIDRLAGRLSQQLTLYYRDQPYIIRSDLTIMPNAQLVIAPGVQMEFYPSVGILALGTIIAQGTSDAPITMRPITLQKMELLETMQRIRYDEETIRSVRLCGEEKCERGANEGFLEYFNKTTLQWIPMCDNRFTERNVQVVCRQLGFDTLNVFFDYDRRIEYQYNSLNTIHAINRIRAWPEPFQCVGDETSLDDCPVRMNGQLYGYDYPCYWNDNFLYIHCGARNLNKTMDYWGGIRFAVPDFEQHFFESRMHDAVTHTSYEREESILEYVHLYGAGILHNEKSPAILSTMQSPHLRYVNITKSASHGISIISAPKHLRIVRNTIYDNMGIAFTGVSLSGESSQSDSSSFFPLRRIEIPYGLFGLVDICDTNKEIVVEERVILYYKYDNFPVDCVKIFKSVYDQKALGFRLMQMNLFNSTGKPWEPDYIKLIDGDIYNITTEEIVTITMDADPNSLNKFYQTSWPSLSVKLHATGATEYHGFVAEILTIPVSPHGLDRDVEHNITDSIFQKNTLGAVYYGSAGEVSPTVTLEKNRFEDNCQSFYGNFSSCQAALRFDVQNMQHIYITNNFLRGNQGGLRILSDSSGTATSLKSYVRNNVFENNSNRETIYVEGKRSSPYQEFVFYRNIVSRNNANFADNVYLSQVVSNLTENYFSANRGMHTMNVIGFERVRLPIYQSCTHNSYFMNVAIDIENRATIIAGSTGQQYVDNIFVNPANAYELSAVNKSMAKSSSNTIDPIRVSAVDARHNWWGYKGDIPVMGRIRDENDNKDLLRVLFLPFRADNRTLLSGKCPPGYTLVADTCYMYVGGYMNYSEAKDFCRKENASMPYVESNYYSVIHFLRQQQEDYDYYDRVWVQDIDRFGDCTVFATNDVITEDCSYQLPFICETDPKVSIDPLAWTSDSVTIGAMVAAILTLVLIAFFLVFCYTKSKQRKEERLERRNSVRASMRSSRSFTSMGSLRDSEFRRRLQIQKTMNTTQDSALNNYKLNGSIDSFEKSPSQFNSIDTSSYDLYETQTQRTGMSSEFDEPLNVNGGYRRHPTAGLGRPRPVVPPNINGLPPPPPQLTKAQNLRRVQADIATKPTFDLTFQNQNYRDSPSMAGSTGPLEFWDTPAHSNLQGNGHVVKYKNTNASNEFPRSVSMATASTFPLQPMSSDRLNESLDSLTPIPLHHQPISYRVNGNAHPPFSLSYDQLDKNSYHPQTHASPPSYNESSTLTYDESPNINNNLFNMSKSQPLLQNMDREPEATTETPEMISLIGSAAERSPPAHGYRFPPVRGKVKETSLDDLDITGPEEDYALDETVRPVSTYLETSVDDVLPHVIRSAQSQYIPHHQQSSSTYGDNDFKALSSRSKSMPLETEM